jgi:hypothetical protein
MPKIDVNHLQRVLQFQAERRRGRLAIIALLHARVDQLCGWNESLETCMRGAFLDNLDAGQTMVRPPTGSHQQGMLGLLGFTWAKCSLRSARSSAG